MKKYLFIMMLMCTLSTYATNDTIQIDVNKIEKVIMDKNLSASGKTTTKFFAITKGKILIPCTKDFYERFTLSKKYGAVTQAFAVVDRKTKLYKKIF